MHLSDLVAIFALVISFGSFYVSKRSLDLADAMQIATERKLVENERTELLRQISNSKAILNNARIEIGALQANFDIEPQDIKKRMNYYTNLFTEFRPSIENAIKQLEKDYAELTNWQGDVSYSDLMRTKAVFYENLKNFEISHEQAIQCVAIFKDRLSIARNERKQ